MRLLRVLDSEVQFFSGYILDERPQIIDPGQEKPHWRGDVHVPYRNTKGGADLPPVEHVIGQLAGKYGQQQAEAAAEKTDALQ